MKRYTGKFAKAVLPVLPLVFNVIGFTVLEHAGLMDALFNSVLMYTLGYDGPADNILIEIARWTAPLATVSGIVVVFRRLRTRAVQWFRYRRGGSVAVYGDPEAKQLLLQQLGTRGIDGEEDFVKADRYILLGSERENLSFYTRWYERLKDHAVYAKSGMLRSRNLSVTHLRTLRVEEMAARLFWKQRFLYPQFRENGGSLKIVFLGFGRLGEELLTFGLQDLIYAPDQDIEWHIFGEGEKYLSLHPQLEQIEDGIQFYDTPWYRHIALLDEADLVLVLTQDGQAELIEELLSILLRREIDVFAESPAALMLLNEEERLKVFDWKKETQTPEHILEDDLLERAKRINLRYAHLYGQVAETEENAEAEWQKLNTFTRYSNISAADYHGVRMGMLREMGISSQQAMDDPKILDRLAELEHIRWSRYHYLNNWTYGEPDDGKSKDPVKRIHRDLVPYQALAEGEQEKDRENIRVLCSLK